MDTNIYNKVKSVFEKYNIPEKIWFPIMMVESGGNPSSIAYTRKEYSKGLFQINVFAHPQYSATDLLDPEVNAEIAAKVFIKPAYDIAKTLSIDTKQQALITYSGLKNPQNPSEGYIAGNAGIRPSWTNDTMNRFLNYYDDKKQKASEAKLFQDYIIDQTGKKIFKSPLDWDFTNNDGLSIPGVTSTLPDLSTISPSFNLSFSQNVVKIISIILLVIIIVISIFVLFIDSNTAKNLLKGVL